MKKLTSALAATAFIGALALVAPSPASAHTSVCVGTGEATTTPLSYLDAVAGSPGAFHLTIGGGNGVGGCVDASGITSTLTAAGSLTGGCGKSTGNGTLTDGGGVHPFFFQSAGSVLVITSDPTISTSSVTVAVANAVPLPTPGNSCLDDTATKFQVTGGGLSS